MALLSRTSPQCSRVLLGVCFVVRLCRHCNRLSFLLLFLLLHLQLLTLSVSFILSIYLSLRLLPSRFLSHSLISSRCRLSGTLSSPFVCTPHPVRSQLISSRIRPGESPTSRRVHRRKEASRWRFARGTFRAFRKESFAPQRGKKGKKEEEKKGPVLYLSFSLLRVFRDLLCAKSVVYGL